jgi:hypothetical protein
MAGTQVVIDLANSPSFEDKAVLEFFETSGRNLLAAEAAAGIRHHVALSIAGAKMHRLAGVNMHHAAPMPTVRKAAWQMFAGLDHHGHRQEDRFQARHQSHRAPREPAPAPADR